MDNVVRRYLRCGILDYGFARVRCPDCGEEYLLAFSCKCRSFCPSCQKKRQLEFGEFAAGEVFAPVPHRQVVLSIPKRIRLHFFRDRRFLAKLARCGWETMRVISYVQDEDVIWQILNHLGLLEEEPAGSSERAPPDGLPPVREITCVPFFDDLPAGDVDEDWLEAVMNVGAAN